MTSKLRLAATAHLPLIATTSRDSLNVAEVLRDVLAGIESGGVVRPLRPFNPIKSGGEIVEDGLYFFVCPPVRKGQQPLAIDSEDLYRAFQKRGATLILVNPADTDSAMFHAGEIETPRNLIVRQLGRLTPGADGKPDVVKALELSRALGGCTMKEAIEAACLTMARDQSMTLPGLTATRKQMFSPLKGLTQVDTEQPFYVPLPEVADWIKKERSYFLTGKDHRLIARGLLFDGPPGTGKTAGAKWVAKQLGVPLFRVDLGGTKGKYVGQSEGQLMANLDALDAQGPCVALLDEIEKIFTIGGEYGDSATTSTMLSQLLWWLAEHRSRVLVIMTTNNVRAIPPELHREGRVDETITFRGLSPSEASPFILDLLATFDDEIDILDPDAAVAAVLESTLHAQSNPFDPAPRYAHAALSKSCFDYVKAHL